MNPTRRECLLAALATLGVCGLAVGCDPPVSEPTGSPQTFGTPAVTTSSSHPAGSPSAFPASPLLTPIAAAPFDVSWRLGTFPDPSNSLVEDVAYNGQTFAAVGQIRSPGASLADGHAAAWVSTDGLVWTRADDAAIGRLVLTRMGVAPIGTFVATDQLGGACNQGDTAGKDVWDSVDGVTWTPSSFPIASGCPQAFATNGRRIVAVGYDRRVTGGVAAWWSDDGATWNSASITIGGGGLTDVAAAPFGFVAYGYPGVFAYSVDGQTWQSASGRPDLATGPDASDVTLVGTAVGALLVGGKGSGDRTQGLVWTTADGDKWTQLRVATALPNASFWEASVGPRGTLIGGLTGKTGRLEPSAWTTPDGVNWTPMEAFPSGGGAIRVHSIVMSRSRAILFATSTDSAVTVLAGDIVSTTKASIPLAP